MATSTAETTTSSTTGTTTSSTSATTTSSTSSTSATTASSTTTSSSGTSDSSSSTSTASGSSSSGITSSSVSASSSDSSALPSLSDSSSYTTPSVTVPPNSNNPYILRENNPSGTVFIAVGAIVGAIFLVFILYHLIKSIRASRLARRTLAGEKQLFEKFQNNNHTVYGGRNLSISGQTLNYNSEYLQSVSKFPLLSHHPSKSLLNGFQTGSLGGGDTSTLYASDNVATTSNDLTKMFVSPTAEVMTHKRNKLSQGLAGSIFAGSTSNLGQPIPATNRHSQLIPSLYMNDEINNSDYSIHANANANASHNPHASRESQEHPDSNPAAREEQYDPRSKRKSIPSMYLEDLIDGKSNYKS